MWRSGCFALAKQMRLFENLDQWIRRRLRMCFWKRWRFVRTRVQNLLALGVPRRQAFRHAKSRHGPWHMAQTIASGVGMTNAWLHDQGLVSLKSLWVKRAPLLRTASCRPACYVVWGAGGAIRPPTRLGRSLRKRSSCFLGHLNRHEELVRIQVVLARLVNNADKAFGSGYRVRDEAVHLSELKRCGSACIADADHKSC